MLRKVLIGLAIAVGSLVLLVVLVAIAFVVYVGVKNSAANEAAEAFCHALKPGQAIAPLVEPPPADKTWNRHQVLEGEHLFHWYGAPLYARECAVKVADGRVVSVALRTID